MFIIAEMNVSVIITALFIVTVFLEPRRFANIVFFLLTLCSWLLTLRDMLGTGATAVLRMVILMGLIIIPLTVIGSGVYLLYYGYMTRKKEYGMVKSLLFLLVVGIVSLGIWCLTWIQYRHFEYRHFTVFRRTMSSWDYVRDFSFLWLWMLVLTVAVTVLCFWMYSISFRWLPCKRDFDYMIVHGDGLQKGKEVSLELGEYLDRAMRVYEKCCRPEAKIIASGMQIRLGNLSEAAMIRKYFMDKGLSAAQIVMEETGNNVTATLVQSKRLLDSLQAPYSALIFTDDYLMFRMNLYARKMKMNVEAVGYHSHQSNRAMQFFREYLIAMMYYKGWLILWLIAATAGIVWFLML